MDCRDMILSDDYIEVIVDFPTELLNIPQAQEGEYCVTPISNDLQIVYMQNPSPQELPLDRFGYRIMPKLYGLLRQDALQLGVPNAGAVIGLEAAGIRPVQRPPLSLLGNGVTIAFIDTGINFANEEFRDEAGDSRLIALWDQNIQTGRPPEGFFYGTEYGREELNEALRGANPYDQIPSRDEAGHGSAMASVAAGSRIGAAPRAELVVVKLRPCKPYLKQYYRAQTDLAYSETDILQALRYVREFSVPFQRPLVICLGLGTNLGDHTGSSALARFLEEIALDKSTCVLVAGGNEGNRRGHVEGEFDDDIGDPVQSAEVELRVGPGEAGLFVEFWGSLPDFYQIRLRTPGGEEIPWSDLSLRQSLSYGFVYERGRVSIYTEVVEGSSGEQLTILRFTQPSEGVWSIGVRGVGNVQSGTFHLWLPMEQFLGADTYFLVSSPNVTLTEPSLANGVITMTAYNDRNDSFYLESGRGFARNGLPKPDLAAPGVGVTTLAGEVTGSSMAVAFGAGAAALFLEWAVLQANRPFVSTKEIKNYFIKGATRDPSLSYPNPQWGYGRLNLSDVFTALASSSRT
ncbi:MAG: S8 family peptidase [Lachnospiraceae bacterium]|nr:S8 family peptidase [Lachnospiraceae bacterium]